MPSLAVISLTILPILGSVFPMQAAQPPAQAQATPSGRTTPSPAETGYPVSVQLATLVDHADTFAGQFVLLAPARVTRVVAPGLVELRDAREEGPYSFNLHDKHDRLLARLPAGVSVAEDDHVLVTGTVATVRGARAGGQLDAAASEKVRKRGNEALLVVSAVTTTEGVSAAGPR